MIHVEDLVKSYGKVRAVQGATFRAPDGTVTGLLGPNGAGKTSTLRIISSLVKPDAGDAWVNGVSVTASPLHALANLGLLPDSRGLYPRLSAREHLLYFGRLHGLTGRELDARVEELVETLEMQAIANRRVEGFSQGERTKVAIGRALVHRPNNIILDEPTNGLDIMSARAVRELIRKLAQDGMCVLFSSHVMSEVAALCDKLVVFNRGRVAHEGTPEAFLKSTGESDLEQAFVQVVGQGQGG